MALIYRTKKRNAFQGRKSAFDIKPSKKRKILPFVAAGVIVLCIFLLTVLQANISSNQLASATSKNRSKLQEAVLSTSSQMQKLNIEKEDDSKKLLTLINQLSAKADEVSNTCVRAMQPYFRELAIGYEKKFNDCQNMTANARSLNEALDGMLPIATYQTELQKALVPLLAVLKGEEKNQPAKLLDGWRSFRDELRKIEAPMALTDINANLIDTASTIITSLESITDEATPSYSSLLSVEDQLKSSYEKVQDVGAQIELGLVEAQKKLTASTAKI